ncbi:MAG: hypothetical protein V8R91_12155 [Butyricimonas faecihominis]
MDSCCGWGVDDDDSETLTPSDMEEWKPVLSFDKEIMITMRRS